MGADPLSILQQIVGFVLQIKHALEKAGHNAEDCNRTGAHLRMLMAIAERLHGAPGVMDGPLMRDAAKGLEDAMQRASTLVAKCQEKSFPRRAFEADDIADKLRGVCLDVLLNLITVLLANGIHSTSMVAEIKEVVTQLRANDACTSSKLDRILQNFTPNPEVEELVQNYRGSTEHATSQIKNNMESQNESKKETNKRDVARLQAQENNGLGYSEVPQASISDGFAGSVSGESVVGQNGSGTIINKLYQIMSISTKDMTLVKSIDAHPVNTWIVMGHQGGYFSIWDYQKQSVYCVQETVMKLQVNKVPVMASWLHGISIKEKARPHWVCSTKFIVQEKWLAVGDGRGYIYIYTYTDTKLCEVKKFEAHETSVDTLCVHPTEPYLLSSSAYGNKIKLWDWSRNWKEIEVFNVKPCCPDGGRSLKFNPRDTNTFACVTDDNRVKVANINSSYGITTRLNKEAVLDADYFFTDSQQDLMVTISSSAPPNCKIWDLATGNVVHTLDGSGRKMRRVAGHPKLPILVSASDDGTVYYWDARTYRLVEMAKISDSKPRDLVFFTDINGLTRLVAACETTIAIMELNLPIGHTGW